MEHDKVAECVRLRTEGLTYRDIGAALGISPQTAMRWLDAAEQAVNKANLAPVVAAIHDYRERATQQCEAVWSAHEHNLDSPSRSAVALRAVELAAKLQGVLQTGSAVTVQNTVTSARTLLINHRSGEVRDVNTGLVMDPDEPITGAVIAVDSRLVPGPTMIPGTLAEHNAKLRAVHMPELTEAEWPARSGAPQVDPVPVKPVAPVPVVPPAGSVAPPSLPVDEPAYYVSSGTGRSYSSSSGGGYGGGSSSDW